MKRTEERGFTVAELVVVIAVLIGLLAASLLSVRPKSYANLDNDANRRLGLAALAQGVKEYRSKVGTWPAELPAAATQITNLSGGYDLCKYLVPSYLQDMAFDPQAGIVYTGEVDDPQLSAEACNVQGVSYSTGYEIRKNGDETVTLTAPAATGGVLEITVR